MTWAIYLALPFSLHPSFVVLQFATRLALSVADMERTFKNSGRDVDLHALHADGRAGAACRRQASMPIRRD